MALTGKTALIVDDDKSFRILLKRILEKEGIVANEADSIKTAFQELNKFVPHFVFLDMNLPKESGLEFLENVRAVPGLRGSHIVVVSGSSEKDLIFKALALGAEEYIVKPIDSQKLIQKLQKMGRDGRFLSYTFPDVKRPRVDLLFHGKVLRCNSTGFEISAFVKSIENSSIYLSGQICNALGFSSHALLTVGGESHFVGRGNYLTEFLWGDLDGADSRRVNKVFSSWNEVKTNVPKDTVRGINPLVLIVDDDPAFNTIAGKLLGKLGIRSEAHLNAEEFIKRLKKGDVDACLVDLNLETPRIGFRLVEAIRNVVGPYLPLFVISGDSQQELISEAMELGCDGYIVKSGNSKSLSERLAQSLLPKGIGENVQRFEVPKEFSAAFIQAELELVEIDELGVKLVGNHLPSKGAELILSPFEVSDEVSSTQPISLVVSKNWVEEASGKFGFYAEYVYPSDQTSSIVSKLLARK